MGVTTLARERERERKRRSERERGRRNRLCRQSCRLPLLLLLAINPRPHENISQKLPSLPVPFVPFPIIIIFSCYRKEESIDRSPDLGFLIALSLSFSSPISTLFRFFVLHFCLWESIPTMSAVGEQVAAAVAVAVKEADKEKRRRRRQNRRPKQNSAFLPGRLLFTRVLI